MFIRASEQFKCGRWLNLIRKSSALRFSLTFSIIYPVNCMYTFFRLNCLHRTNTLFCCIYTIHTYMIYCIRAHVPPTFLPMYILYKIRKPFHAWCLYLLNTSTCRLDNNYYFVYSFIIYIWSTFSYWMLRSICLCMYIIYMYTIKY